MSLPYLFLLAPESGPANLSTSLADEVASVSINFLITIIVSFIEAFQLLLEPLINFHHSVLSFLIMYSRYSSLILNSER